MPSLARAPCSTFYPTWASRQRWSPRFDVIVDGDVAAREDLAGKPEPDTYLAAAGELGVDPGQAVVVEDALSGVASGAAGGFGVTIGVDRGAGHRALLDNGADVVVDDLAELIP